MKYCVYCGNEIRENAVICTKCGASVHSTEKVTTAINTYQTTQIEQKSKYNVLCILGFVFSFFFGLLGLILSCIGLSQSNKNNEKGQSLAIAGIVISCLILIFHIVIIAIYGIAIFWSLLWLFILSICCR